MNELEREKLEVLDGSRGKQARRRAAVRIEDLAALLQMPPQLASTPAAGATPTKAEFDKLRADVDTLRARLLELATALQDRIR